MREIDDHFKLEGLLRTWTRHFDWRVGRAGVALDYDITNLLGRNCVMLIETVERKAINRETGFWRGASGWEPGSISISKVRPKTAGAINEIICTYNSFTYHPVYGFKPYSKLLLMSTRLRGKGPNASYSENNAQASRGSWASNLKLG